MNSDPTTVVEQARKILHGPCQCGRQKPGAEPFCKRCMQNLCPAIRHAVDEIEMAEPFMRFYNLALLELAKSQKGHQAAGPTTTEAGLGKIR